MEETRLQKLNPRLPTLKTWEHRIAANRKQTANIGWTSPIPVADFLQAALLCWSFSCSFSCWLAHFKQNHANNTVFVTP